VSPFFILFSFDFSVLFLLSCFLCGEVEERGGGGANGREEVGLILVWMCFEMLAFLSAFVFTEPFSNAISEATALPAQLWI